MKEHSVTITTGTIVRALLFVALAWLLWYLRDIVLVVLTAVVIASAVEPGNSSALDRVRSIEADRARIVALQSMIDSVGAIKPAAGRDLATVAKRMSSGCPTQRATSRTDDFGSSENTLLRGFGTRRRRLPSALRATAAKKPSPRVRCG